MLQGCPLYNSERQERMKVGDLHSFRAKCLEGEELQPVFQVERSESVSLFILIICDIIEGMKQVLTLVCKLQPTPEQSNLIEATLKAFADACNYTNQTVKPSITSSVSIQNLVYPMLREQFGLSANLAVRACARVGANRKTAKVKGKHVLTFSPTSADYDARIFAFREQDWTVSLTLVGGREHIKLNAGNYQRGKLAGKKPTSAQLCKHRDGEYYIHIQIKDEAPAPIKSDKVIGVDFGRRDIAVTSIGDKWDGFQITEIRDKYSRVRASLQKKATIGTRSTRRRARRILKRLRSSREKISDVVEP